MKVKDLVARFYGVLFAAYVGRLVYAVVYGWTVIDPGMAIHLPLVALPAAFWLGDNWDQELDS